MNFHYNLVDEEWIPCIDHEGVLHYQSLRQTLLSAHDIQEIHAELPPMTASLLMLLLAVLYRCLRIETAEGWLACWEKGAFDAELINRYLDEWHARFDLFDTAHPFYQDARLGVRPEDIKKLKGKDMVLKGVNGLILHSSNGDAATLFDHSTDAQEVEYFSDQIVRLVLMFQGFCLGGMSSAAIPADKFYKDSPNSRAAVFFLRGNNLFETLMLNLIAREGLPEHLEGSGKDRPAWEMDDALEDMRQVPYGIMDFLTWQSRRILLHPVEKNGKTVVQNLYPAPGLGLSEQFENPFFHNSYEEATAGKMKKKLLRFFESKALWRDSLSILQPQSDYHIPPCALSWINDLRVYDVLNKDVCFYVYGLCTEPGQKKAYFYREEHFSYPLVYLDDQSLRNELEICLEQAQSVSRQLYGAMNQMAALFLAFQSDLTDGKKADPGDVKNLMAHWDCDARFWQSLERPFFHLVNRLPQQPGQARKEWQDILRFRALEAFEHAQVFTGDSIAAMKAAGKAHRQLLHGLKKVLGPQQKEKE